VPRARVEASAAGQRLDHFVASAVAGLTVHGARRLIADGGVRVDGRRSRKGDRLVAGQTVEIEAGGAPVIEPDTSVAIEVLFADETLVAIAKPAGVPSHPLQAGERDTAANALVARFPECATASPDAREAGLVNRLDTDTSGVLLAARSPAAWQALRAAIAAPTCEKSYLAEVVGAPPAHGAVDVPIGRSGRRGARVRVGSGRRPLPARTEWEVVAARAGTTLLRARLHAGRAHQVRAHLAAAGYPILGDLVYADDGARALAAERGVTRPRLHAATVSLPHPISGRPILIEAPAPAWAAPNSDI
jgi:23S rRNA pseudouridine1911/1915/1917 synthase